MLAGSALFLSSYAPLFVLLAVKFENRAIQTVLVLAAIVGCAGLLIVLGVNHHVSAAPHRITSASHAGSEAAGYLSAYLLPFLTIPQPGKRDVILYLGFLAIAWVVHVRSAMVQVNPFLYLLGFTVFAVEDSNGFRGYVISRYQIGSGSRLECAPLAGSDNVLVDWSGPQ